MGVLGIRGGDGAERGGRLGESVGVIFGELLEWEGMVGDRS